MSYADAAALRARNPAAADALEYGHIPLTSQLDLAIPALYSPGQIDDAQALALAQLLSPDRTGTGTDRNDGFTD